ncbi:MAG TPA: hypothetical protein VLE89_04060 [Chlamydiales bacterium]|nr:hypothetical protein [Chlamydiales bacterium]
MSIASQVFAHIDRTLEPIKDPAIFESALNSIEDTALKVDQMKKDGFFSVTYIREIPKELYPKFRKALQIKARDATGIVPSIDRCKFKEELPMGFKRVITIGDHEALQRVWTCETASSFKIIFKTDGIKFIATNELEKREDRNLFTARYIMDEHPKYKTPQWFLEHVMDPTFDNLIKLSLDPQLNQKHAEIVGPISRL